MKIDAVAVASSDLPRSIDFYSLLGFEFPPLEEGQEHVEPITSPGSARLMIDKQESLASIIGEPPTPGNHSAFAIQFDSPEAIDQVCTQIKNAGFTIVKAPWDAFWGQRYAILADPDGYKIDLYAPL